jgi:glycosyltransferase involved in cell wall biosynthesis
MPDREQPPFVAVWMVTYNQEKYISQAIEGVLIQKTKFKIKLFIGEDCSTDNTRAICQKYEKENSERIELICTAQNNIIDNAKNVYRACADSGAKYVAMCEGDDYWIDENKLQTQVDFLESNPDYSICFHNIYELSADRGLRLSPFYTSKEEKTYTIEELARGNFISTASVVFRNGFVNIHDLFKEALIGDYVLYLINAQHGKIKYLVAPMSVYRIHNNGIYSSKSQKYQCEGLIRTLKKLIDYFHGSGQIVENMKWQTAFLKSQLADIYLKEQDKEEYLRLLKEAFLESPVFMNEWLLASKNNYNTLLESKEYKIGWALKNPWFMIKKYVFPQKERK